MTAFLGIDLTVLFGILFAICAVVYGHFFWSFQYWKKRRVPFFDPSFPWGNLNFFSNDGTPGDDLIPLVKAAYKKGWKYFGLYSTSKPVLVPVDLDLVKCIMAKDFQYFTDRGEYYNEEDDPISANVFAVGGAKWKKLRTKLTPTFTSGKLKGMFHTLVSCGETLEQILKEHNEEEPVDIKHVLACFTTDVIGSCAFGIECNAFKEPNSPFLVNGKRMFSPGKFVILKVLCAQMFPNFVKMLRMTVTPPDISKFYYDVVTSTVNYREKNNYSKNDFLQLLIDMKNKEQDQHDKNGGGSSLTMDEIVAQCFVFFIAGYETSSTTMSFALYELAIHPEIQQKVRNEIFEVLKKYNNEICYEALKEMTYMQQVLDETLRKYPPLPFVTRDCVHDYKIPDSDVLIEKGTQVLIPIKCIHYTEDFYENPNEFDPERFSTEEKEKRHPYAHIPFGEGPRICIGLRFGVMQAKVGLVSVLRNYRISLSSKTKTPIKMEKMSFSPSVEGGLWLNLEKI